MIITAYRAPVAMALDRAPYAIKGMAFDKLALDRGTVRSKDRDGRLHLSVTNISKASVDPYYGEEIPGWEGLGLEPKRVYQLLRDPGELADGAPTFNNLPILDEHIPVSADDPQKSHHIGTTGTDAAFNDPYLQNSAVVDVQEAIDDIEAERKKEWSCGYYYTADMTPGIFQGLRYDGVMRNIIGNHVALVDAGRAGSDVVVGDRMPRGLIIMKPKIKSRAALMLNGALAAMIGPKLAMDKKLDLSKVLGGVTAKNIGKNPNKLAGQIVAATKGVLAQDEAMDADDVVKVIAALTGSTSEMTEDEDMIEGSDPAPTVDEDPDADQEGDTPEEKEAKRKRREAKQAKDDLPGGGEGKGVPPKPDKAMDAAQVRMTVAETIAELRTAEREVAPIIGEVKIACDSAADVYKLALDHAKVDLTGVHPSAYRAMVGMLGKSGKVAAPAIALDHKTVRDDFNARFKPGELLAN